MNKKYEFSMNNSLHIADIKDYDDLIVTKIIVVSPKYVFVNQMRSSIEVAQLHTEYVESCVQVMEVGDSKEWIWPDCNKESLVCVRKVGW